MNATRNQKMTGEAMAIQSNKHLNQLKSEATATDAEEEEQETAF